MSSPVTERERAIVRALQNDLPLVPEPYAALAEEMQISEEELMAGIQTLMDTVSYTHLPLPTICSV